MIYDSLELNCIPTPNVPNGCVCENKCTKVLIPTGKKRVVAYQHKGEVLSNPVSQSLLGAYSQLLTNPEAVRTFQEQDPEIQGRFIWNFENALKTDNPCFYINQDNVLIPVCPNYQDGSCKPVIASHEDSGEFPIIIPVPTNIKAQNGTIPQQIHNAYLN